MMDAIRNNLDAIAEVKVNLATGNISRAAEAWYEMGESAWHLLWRAPTKGGIFTTEERNVMETQEFRESYFGK